MKDNAFKKELELLDELEWNFTKASLSENKDDLVSLVNTLKELDKNVRENIEKLEATKQDISKGIQVDLKGIDIDIPLLLKEALNISFDNVKTNFLNTINELKKELNELNKDISNEDLSKEDLSKILEKISSLRFFVLTSIYEEKVQLSFERQLKFKYSIISIIITFLSLVFNAFKHIQMTYFESFAISILIALYFYEINNMKEDQIKKSISDIDKRIKRLYELNEQKKKKSKEDKNV